MRRSAAGDVCAWPVFGETIRTAQAVKKIISSFMSICLDEGLLSGSRMTIDQLSVDNKALTQFAAAKKFAPPGDFGLSLRPLTLFELWPAHRSRVLTLKNTCSQGASEKRRTTMSINVVVDISHHNG